ncbi:MAG TPA: sigma 54-interacting transcriptional regulator [Ignavibacteriaceae bacterium]|nr:sigma 54-interacting transcriptional regulator [Ignavibacteriaceae bacterium]
MQATNEDLSFLLSINDDVAVIKDVEDLLHDVFQKLHEFYGIKIGGGALFDRAKENLALLVLKIEKDKLLNDSNVWLQTFPVNSIPYKISIANPEISRLDAKEFYSLRPLKEKQSSLYEFMQEMNLNTLSFLPMKTGGEFIGFLILALEQTILSDKDEDYLLKLANLIGTVSKIVNSYEELHSKQKEKEIQLELVADLLRIRDKEAFFKKIADETNKLIPCDYIAFHAEYSPMNISSTISLIKDEKDQYVIMPSTRSITLFLLALKSKVNGNNSQNFLEVEGDPFDKMCEQFSHLKQLKEKNSLSSLIVLKHSYENFGELTVVIGRSSPYSSINMNSALDLMFVQSKNAFFGKNEIDLAANILPYLGLILSNLYAFEEIKTLTKKLEQEKNYLLDEINLTNNVQEIIGNSQQLNYVLNKVKQVAPIDATVLILGETGTGKELIAKAIHNLSKRNENAFITVNCAALPVQLIESELFGHEKGSFTGAWEKRIGKFEVADGGTIFLDEIGELPLEVQAKLLRVLQEKEFERLGGKSTVRSDVRIVAATNRNLEKEVEQGKFRPDLFFRINVFPVLVPPLRERKEDIPLLVKFFINKYSKKIGKDVRSIKKNDLDILMNYNWPGNVRELEHIIERAIIISEGSNLNLGELLGGNLKQTEPDFKSFKTLMENEKEHIINALKMANGKVTGEKSAAQLLGVNGKTLGSKMRKLKIKREVMIKSS